MKDHEIAALVNTLRDIAIKYHGSQQLREQIAAVVVPALRGARGPAKTVDSVIAALQQSSSGITAGAENPSQVVDSGAAGPTRTGDLLITNQGAETAETLGNQQDTPSAAPVDGAQAAQGESSTCKGVTAGLPAWNEPCAEIAAKADARIATLEAEKAERDRIISQCAQAVGAFVSPECSDEFRAMLPAEIRGRIDRLERERDALRAERTERERQEPVAWVLFDDIFIASKDMPDDPPNLECMKPLYARPLAIREPTEDECREMGERWFELMGNAGDEWQAIREVMGNASDEIAGRAMWQSVREVMT